MRLNGFGNRRVGARRVMRDTDVAHPSLLFPFRECRQVGLHIEQIVDLHEINGLCAQLCDRVFHLRNAGVLAGDPHFGCDK